MAREVRSLVLMGLVLSAVWLSCSALPLSSDSSKDKALESVKELIIAVKGRDPEGLEKVLLSGVQLTRDQLCRRFGPAPESVEAVYSWGNKWGALHISQTYCGDFLVAYLPASHIAGAFSQVEGLECSELGDCNAPVAVPRELEDFVDFIDGIGRPASAFGKQSEGHRNFDPAARRGNGDSRAEALHQPLAWGKGPWYPECLKESATPPCLRKAYNVTAPLQGSRGGSQGVALFGGQFFSPEDLASFEKQYKLPKAQVKVVNDNKPSEPGNEASLDVQYISAMGSGVETNFIHYACTNEDCKPFLHWIMQQLNSTSPPLVQSVSVGTTEFEYIEAFDEKYLARINQEFMKAGIRGISLLFATGDKASQSYKGKYWINFPSASPYVTAVGGVWLGALGYGPMGVDPDTTGGFSNSKVHKQLEHQKKVVESYLKEAEKTDAKRPKHFNHSLRAVPDVVAMSDAYIIVQHGSNTFIGGTSAACPVVAGLISLINHERLAKGKKSMGFLNPFLYENSHCFEDIVNGHNLYGAVKGWDPASGLGTPIYSCLLDAALKLP